MVSTKSQRSNEVIKDNNVSVKNTIPIGKKKEKFKVLLYFLLLVEYCVECNKTNKINTSI